MLSASQIQTIVSFGGGVVISARSYSAAQLQTIASFAAGKCQVVIKDAGQLSAAQMQAIGSFGKGAVLFDLT
ncbi:hypothetical protein ACZ75_06855 [Massilia sp. NR 4-1]|nr:hypothetical protein ACZ75_06855 [Massilia sp. NR 4-1]